MNEAPIPHTEGGERGTHSTVLSLKRKSDRRFKTDLDEVCMGSLAWWTLNAPLKTIVSSLQNKQIRCSVPDKFFKFLSSHNINLYNTDSRWVVRKTNSLEEHFVEILTSCVKSNIPSRQHFGTS